MISAFFHEGQANEKAGMRKRMEKYGGDKKAGEVVNLGEDNTPGILTKKIVRPGNGELPNIGHKVFVHYTGMLEDGTEFDTSAGRGPLSFLLAKGEVIRGWDYAVSTMQKGERVILTIGPEYAYGPAGSGPIPANATLTFEMELVRWEEPPLVEIYHWIGLLVVFCIIFYVLFIDDEEDRLRKAGLMIGDEIVKNSGDEL